MIRNLTRITLTKRLSLVPFALHLFFVASNLQFTFSEHRPIIFNRHSSSDSDLPSLVPKSILSMVELRKPTQIQNHVAPPAPVPPAEPESMAIANTLNSATGAESSSAFAGPPDTRHFDQSITAHDGNVLQKSRAFHRHIRRKFTGPNGVFTKFLITIDLVLLAMFVLVQNMMISQLFGSTLLPNFFNPTILYVLDVICILLFYYSVVNTRRYYQRKCSANSSERDNCRSFSVLNLNFTFPEKMGELPFIYISWLFYTIVFVSRIVFIQFAISQVIS